MDGSRWRCTHVTHGSDECSAVVSQQQMQEHLRVEHRIKNPRNPYEVLSHFVLIVGAPLRGGPRREVVEDDTLDMFPDFKEIR